MCSSSKAVLPSYILEISNSALNREDTTLNYFNFGFATLEIASFLASVHGMCIIPLKYLKRILRAVCDVELCVTFISWLMLHSMRVLAVGDQFFNILNVLSADNIWSRRLNLVRGPRSQFYNLYVRSKKLPSTRFKGALEINVLIF